MLYNKETRDLYVVRKLLLHVCFSLSIPPLIHDKDTTRVTFIAGIPVLTKVKIQCSSVNVILKNLVNLNERC